MAKNLLKETGLFGQGLFLVKTKTLVKRYNECLEGIGLTATSLTSFHIDGWGWSPEIADEKEDPFYLSFGGPANPFAIIIVPEQAGRPIFFPYHSFDRRMMETVFSVVGDAITNVTTQTGVWIEFDQGIQTFRTPKDLLMVDGMKLSFHTPGDLIDAKRKQRELIQKFEEGDNWADEDLRIEIIKSAKQFGDLRYQNLELHDISYTKVRTFYTRAFDGVFVIRDTPGKKHLLVFRDPAQAKKGAGEAGGYIEHTLTDSKKLLEQLAKEKLVDINSDYWWNHLPHLRRIQECLLIDAYAEHYEDSFVEMPKAKQRGFVDVLAKKNALPEVYFELGDVIKKLSADGSIKTTKLSLEVSELMLHPPTELPEAFRQVIWQILVNCRLVDVLSLYVYDKEKFFELFPTWAPCKQEWVVAVIKASYHPTFPNTKIGTK